MTNVADNEENTLPEKDDEKTKGCVPVKSSYQLFVDSLRHPSANQVLGEVRDFVDSFAVQRTSVSSGGSGFKLQAATRFHDFLSAKTPKLLATTAFAEATTDEAKTPKLLATTAFAEATTDEAKAAAADGFEKFVVTKLHKVLFRSLPADVTQDDIAEKKLQEKQESHLSSLKESCSDEAKDLFELAVKELKKVDQYKAPSDKVVCMLNAYRLADTISEELKSKGWKPPDTEATSPAKAGDHSPGGTHENTLLGRVLEALLIEAIPPNLFSNIEFAAAFRHPPRLTSEERRCLNDFSAALVATTGCNAKVPMAVIGAGGTWGSFEELPPWLVDSGVTFRFESAEVGDLVIEEVDDLLVAYQRMADVLQSLAESPPLAK